MKEKLRNQFIKDENMRSRCASTKHRKKRVSQGACFSQMAGRLRKFLIS